MSDPSSARSLQTLLAPSRPPLRFRGWPLWGWLVLTLAGVATLAYEAYTLPWLAFGLSAEHPAPQDVAAVQDGARGLTLTLLAPWALAAILLRPRVRVAVAGIVCAAPAIWFWWETWQTH